MKLDVSKACINCYYTLFSVVHFNDYNFERTFAFYIRIVLTTIIKLDGTMFVAFLMLSRLEAQLSEGHTKLCKVFNFKYVSK